MKRSHFPSHAYFRGGAFLPFAHRGGAARFPENTHHAFAGAKALGYRHIETDVQLTADGEVAIFHDLTLERTTNGRGRVGDTRWEDMAALDAAHGFCPSGDGSTFPLRGCGIGPLRLVDALDAFPDLFFNLEMKGNDDALADTLFQLIQDRGVASRVLVASANDGLTARFRSIADGSVPTSAGQQAILQAFLWSRVGRLPKVPYDALQVPFRHGRLRVVDERFVRAAHAAQVAVHVWTIDEPTLIGHLHELGVDGIMTDRPEVLRDTLASAAPACFPSPR
ncbi:MAG: glycerophosphodiester phosphodiesterase [Myxococcota bacterium]